MGLGTSPQGIAGLGPFRLKEYVTGQRITLERNPYYWKVDRNGTRLPYLDQITFLFVANADAEVIRFQAGDTDIINRISAEDYSVLEKEQGSRAFHLFDVGPSLEFNFLFFNMNTVVPASLPNLSGDKFGFETSNSGRQSHSASTGKQLPELCIEDAELLCGRQSPLPAASG